MTSVSERFLRYVGYHTTSDEFSETCPSTDRQKLLGALLVLLYRRRTGKAEKRSIPGK